MSAKNVLYISPNAHLGGAEKACELFLKFHDRNRYKPQIVFLRNGPLVQQFKQYDVRVHLMPTVRLRDFHLHPKLIRSLSELIQNQNIDLVHSSMAYGHFFGGRAANRSKISNVWFQHGPVNPKLDRFISLVRTNGVLLNSECTKTAQRKIMWRKFPLYVVYAGIDQPPTDPNLRESLRIDFRSKWKISNDEIVIGSVGRLQEWKGQMEFLKAFHIASSSNNRLRALICGGPDIGSREYEKALKNYIQENHLQSRVIMTGFLDDLESALQSMDVLVHSSIMSEPFGLVPIEGMIRGIPVIACPWGGPSETIENHITGLLVDPKDSAALAKNMLDLAGNFSLREKLGSNGKEAAKRYLGPHFVSRVESVYDSILKDL